MKMLFIGAMMTTIASGLCGCAEVDRFENWATSAKTVQTVSVLKQGASAFVCSIANATAVAGQVEAAVKAGQSVQGADGKLYVASQTICGSLGGAVVGAGVVQ